jgi:hypothetical protein
MHLTSLPTRVGRDFRYRAHADNTCENDTTIEDPVAFTIPWQAKTATTGACPSDSFAATNCNESPHSSIINGQTQFILPNDPPPGCLLGPIPMKK